MPESTILIVDDEPAIRDMVGITLDLAGFNSISATNALEAHISIIDNKPDLVLLDWMLPGGTGIELARRLRRDSITTNIPIIMLTAKTSEDNKVQGLSEGVDDYVTKPFSVRELVARIHAVLRRVETKERGNLLTVGPLTIDIEGHNVALNDVEIMMSPTEFKLLYFLASHPDKVFSRNQLLDNVWGDNVYVEDRTVDVHIRRLRKILEAQGCADLVQTVRGFGYKLTAT